MGDWPTNPPPVARHTPHRRRDPHRPVLACAVVFAASQVGLVWWLLAHGVTSTVPAVCSVVASASFVAAVLTLRWPFGQREGGGS